MRKLIVLATLLLAAVACMPKHQLVIVHFNDTHSHFDPQRDGTGGVIERAAFVDSVRAEEGPGNVLLLHAGDFGQGSSYFTELHGDLEIDMINAMGYDCITLGNHEFDNGIEELGRRLSSVQCPVVVCNYDFSPFEAGKYITPYTIVRKAGRKIGIIGVLCNIKSVVSREISDRIPALDMVEEVTRWTEYLRNEEKCDIVMLLTHIGFRGEKENLNDTELLPLISGVDLIVGGHSHTHLTEMYVGQDADGKDVPIVQNWCWGQEAGLLRVD